jgi:hypothetical protein
MAAIAASIAASANRPVPVVEALPVACLGLRWSRLRDVRTGNGPRVLWAGEGDTAHFRAALNAARPALSDVGFSWGTRERNGGDVIPVCWENPARPESDVLDAVAVAEQAVREKAEADRLKAQAEAAAEAAAWYRDGAARQEAVDALRASLKAMPWAWSRRKAELARALLKDRPSERDARLARELVDEVETMVAGVLARVGSERIEACWERAADPVVRAAALSASRVLSALDEDHASIDNKSGWSKAHSHSGHVLSGLDELDQTQASQALRAVYAHRRQLPRKLREAVLGAGV